MGISIEHPEYLLLFLLLVPVASVWYWWEWRKKSIRAGMANHPRLLKTLLHHYRPRWALFRLIFFCLALSGLCLALLNPRMVDKTAAVPMQGIQVMMVLDVSNSMLANDIAPSRLEKARMFALKLAEKFGGSRIGLLAFAGEARLQMPPTTDLSAIRQAIQTLGPGTVPLQGTHIEAALTEAYNSLAADALKQKGVVLVTDGEALEGDAAAVAAKFGRSGMVVHVVSVGSEQGSLLLDPDTGLPLMDENDRQVLSKPDNELLQQIAQSTGGRFLRLENTDAAVLQVSAWLADLEKNPLPNGDLVNYYSFAPWILLLVLIFLTVEWWQPLFRKKVPVMAALLVSVLFFATPSSAQPTGHDLKSGLEAYKKGEYRQALEVFGKVLENNPGHTEARFYQSLAQYRLQQFPAALSGFTEVAQTAAKPEIQSAAWNNAGLSSVENKQPEQAVELFKKALKTNPGDEMIRRNLQKVLLDLMQQNQSEKEQKPKEQPPMNQDDAQQKLQEVMEQERQAREKMKPRSSGASTRKNW